MRGDADGAMRSEARGSIAGRRSRFASTPLGTIVERSRWKAPANNPHGAFLGWVKRFTKGKAAARLPLTDEVLSGRHDQHGENDFCIYCICCVYCIYDDCMIHSLEIRGSPNAASPYRSDPSVRPRRDARP